MRYESLPIEGAFLVHLEPHGDERGFFARLFCEKEFGARGMESRYVQVNNSFSADRGTLRGMHYQLAPAAEAKLVRCLSGSLYDVILDLRPDSPTFSQSFGAVLDGSQRSMMYCPPGCAHGFLTLESDTEALYLVSAPYSPDLERGVRWDDPFFKIDWPETPCVVSLKDQAHPDWQQKEALLEDPVHRC